MRAAEARRSAWMGASTPTARSSGYWVAIASSVGASSRSSRARSAASETSGMPEWDAATAASLRNRLSLGERVGGGAQTTTVGRVCTMSRRMDRAKPSGSPVGIAPVPAISHASRAPYSSRSAVGTSARMRGSRRGGFRSSIEKGGHGVVEGVVWASLRTIPVKSAPRDERTRSGGTRSVSCSA